MFKMSIHGERSAERALTQFGDKVAKKIGRKAVRAGAGPVRRAAKKKVPVRYGFLKKSLVTVVRRYKHVMVAVTGADRAMVVTATKGEGVERIVPSKYLHLVEMGTVTTNPQPFLRPAFTETKSEQLAKMTEKLNSEISAELNKTRLFKFPGAKY